MRRRLLFLLALTIALAPTALADDGPSIVQLNDPCLDPLCIIACVPAGAGLTGDPIPPVWVDVYETCIRRP